MQHCDCICICNCTGWRCSSNGLSGERADNSGVFYGEREPRASRGLQSVHSYWGRRAAAARLWRLVWRAHWHRAGLLGRHCYSGHLALRLLLTLLALALAACAARGPALPRQRGGVRVGCARGAGGRRLEPVRRPASTQRGCRRQASRLTHPRGARDSDPLPRMHSCRRPLPPRRRFLHRLLSQQGALSTERTRSPTLNAASA